MKRFSLLVLISYLTFGITSCASSSENNELEYDHLRDIDHRLTTQQDPDRIGEEQEGRKDIELLTEKTKRELRAMSQRYNSQTPDYFSSSGYPSNSSSGYPSNSPSGYPSISSSGYPSNSSSGGFSSNSSPSSWKPSPQTETREYRYYRSYESPSYEEKEKFMRISSQNSSSGIYRKIASLYKELIIFIVVLNVAVLAAALIAIFKYHK